MRVVGTSAGRRFGRIACALFVGGLVLAPLSAARDVGAGSTYPPIAFVSELHDSEVYIANGDGTAPRRLTSDVVGSRWPALSPDGTEIAYARHTVAGWSIIVSRLNGAGARDITAEAGLGTGFSGYPDWSPDGKQVIFSHENPDLPFEAAIVSFDLATGAEHAITNLVDATALWPRISPDGTKIVYAAVFGERGYDIYTIGVDGTNPTRLTRAVGWEIEPTWSPDGTQIAYAGVGESNSDIIVMNADGSSPHDVTNTPRSSEVEPSWTARGIYFRGDATGQEQLGLIRPDGTGLRMLTSGLFENSDPYASSDGKRIVFVSGRNSRSEITIATPRFKAVTHGPHDSDPSWSRDHRFLAFVRARGVAKQDIWVVRADGSGPRNLTRGRGVNWGPAWSPDGKSVAFVRFESFGAQIWLMRSDGSAQRALTTAGALNDHPSWSPDGRSIVYSSERNGNYDLYIADVRTGKERRLTRDINYELSPAWSPDGKLIAFAAPLRNAATEEIWAISPKGGPMREVSKTSGPDGHDNPTWSPDSKVVAFTTDHFLGHVEDIWTENVDGTNPQRTVAEAWDEDWPTW